MLSFASTVLAAGVDTSNGKGIMVPVPGKITIDGNLNDWDLSAKEQVTLDVDTEGAPYAGYAFMYDETYLYLAVNVRDSTPLRNIYGPMDMFWRGDIIQLRLGASSELSIPLSSDGPSDAKLLKTIAHISIWRNHLQHKNYIHIVRGQIDSSDVTVNTPGSDASCHQWPDGKGYTVECRVPWSALGVDHAPKPGSSVPAILEVLWSDADGRSEMLRAAALYRSHPGTKAFVCWNTWGQLLVSSEGKLSRNDHQELAALRKKLRIGYIPISFKVKKPGAVSLNILDSKGCIVRELVKESIQNAGPITFLWDGRNYAGQPVPPGRYHWKAMSYHQLKTRYIGGVGSSVDVPYDTPDGLGGWGSDHLPPVDAAVDSSGKYFLWPAAEQGRSVVKTDNRGKVIWRKSPISRSYWGDYTSIATDGKYVYLLSGMSVPEIIRLDALTGDYKPYQQDRLGTSVSGTDAPKGSGNWVDSGTWVATGLAVNNGLGYVSLYIENRISIVNLQTGSMTGELKLDRPYGVCFDGAGNLYAISRGTNGASGKVVKYVGAKGDPVTVVSDGLLEPVDLAVMPNGDILVTDSSPQSNQVKRFNSAGQLIAAYGATGGRKWAGKYDSTSFLKPWGIASDGEGGYVVVENSPPKVITWFDNKNSVRKRWFGPATYGTGVWADPTDPFTVYWVASATNDGKGVLARSRIDATSGKWSGTEAYWDFEHAGYPAAFYASHSHANIFNMPNIVSVGGFKFESSDFAQENILRIDGDSMVPVGYLNIGIDGRPEMVSCRPSSGKPKALETVDMIHKPFPEVIKSGVFLEGESESAAKDHDAGIPRVFRSESSHGWQNILEGGATQAIIRTSWTGQEWPLRGQWLRWNLHGAGLHPGKYECYLQVSQSGNGVPYNMNVSAGSSGSNLTTRISDSNGSSPARDGGFGWISIGDMDIKPDDSVIQLDIKQINTDDLRVDCLLLRAVDNNAYPKLGGDIGLFGYGVDDKLNVYFEDGRRIVRIPCTGIDPDGWPKWDNSHYKILVKDYAPGVADTDLVDGWRHRCRGIRVDNAGNMYVSWSAGPESSGPFWSAHLTKTRLNKYSPDGALLWSVGQKAMSPRKDGEIYDTWVLAGVANDRYAALGDETGLIHFYTSSGFYRGHIFNDLAQGPAPGPETFTGETFSGRVLYDRKSGKYYAYQGQTAGLMFEILGLGDEQYYSGTINVAADSIATDIPGKADVPGAIPYVSENFGLNGPDSQWDSLSPFTIRQGDKHVSSVYVAYNKSDLFARWDVLSKSPFRNGADDPTAGFTGGDAVDLYLGPAGTRNAPAVGDVRIMVVPGRDGKAPTVIGLKPLTDGVKRPRTYRSPGQSADFEWVGTVQNARAVVTPFDGGYSIRLSVSRSFLENMDLKPGANLRFDADVLFSDSSGRKTVTRNFIYSTGSDVSMVNDIPTEARLYPSKWKEIELRQNPLKPANAESRITHLSTDGIFDEKDAAILEAESAGDFSKGLSQYKESGVGMLIDNAGLDKPVYITWKLPDGLKPGIYDTWISWAVVGTVDGKMNCDLQLKPIEGAFRSCSKFAVDHGNNYKFKWQKAGRIDVKQNDKYLSLRPTMNDTWQTDFRVDAIAMVPAR